MSLIRETEQYIKEIINSLNMEIDNVGLVKAIDNFDTSYNVTLSTYACPMTLGWSKRCRILL